MDTDFYRDAGDDAVSLRQEHVEALEAVADAVAAGNGDAVFRLRSLLGLADGERGTLPMLIADAMRIQHRTTLRATRTAMPAADFAMLGQRHRLGDLGRGHFAAQ